MSLGGADVGQSDDASVTDTIVIDVGSCLTKLGFSGEDSPRTRFTSAIGVNAEKIQDDLNASIASGGDGADSESDRFYFAGEALLERRESVNVTRPVTRAVVQDWDALEKIWEWSFSEELNVDPEAFPVLVMDSVLEHKKSREMMAKIMFEKFNVKSFYVATEAVLSLFSSGVTSGIAVECGEEVVRSLPVFEGFALRHAFSSTRVASRNVYAHFGKGLQAANPKHKLVADMLDLSCLVNQLKEEHACVDINGPPPVGESDDEFSHELPDGSIIHIPYSVCAGSGELLFAPEAGGIRDQKSVTDIVLASIGLCDNDLKAQFKSNIHVAGGTAQVKGFAHRLESEIRAANVPNTDLRQVKVTSDRSNLTDASWVGGSMLASLSTFNFMKIRKQEYDDAHSVIVHRKCF
eukprot:INCI12770.1.p1 GENE.INCI12770.1~~INCI12770.1.p1  ORF type:complete len:437 (-),score=64.35 INCI12770.1:569-1789(-)